jgi:hypothetical protein
MIPFTVSHLCANFLIQIGVLKQLGTQATDKDVFLLQPELGRHFNNASRAEL